MRLTLPEQRSRTSKFPQSSVSVWRLGGAVGLAAAAVFLAGVHERAFVDEYAYITQSYYSDLFFKGRLHDPAWLDYPALDLQPLPKYFIGISLRRAGVRLPAARDAYRWYGNSHTKYGPPLALTAARLPFIATGVLGCLALYIAGVLVGGRWVGAIGAALLLINPLYRLHAHRAMSDVPCEAFLIAALGLALWACHRILSCRAIGRGLVAFAAAGVFSGLAIVCKFNGFLAPMIIAAWCGLGLLIPRLDARARLALAGGAALTILMALATFLALNPSLTARPYGPMSDELAARAHQGPFWRFRKMIAIRLEISRGQQERFPHNALRTLAERLPVFAVQGFGRFGPLGPRESDSVIRYDLRQDWGLVLWWPLVMVGFVRALRMGRRQLNDGAPPTALALLIWAAMAWAVVAVYIPMAWDRYLMPIQAPNALLAAVAVVGWGGRERRKAVQP